MSGGWIDRHGDVWTEGDDGLMHTPETAPFSREHVERKWGPLTPEPSEVAETTAGEREPYCTACLMTDRQCEEADGGCCEVCRATGGCSHTTEPDLAPAEPDAGEVEALAKVICVCTGNHNPETRIECRYALDAATKALASPWLAAHVSAAENKARADALREAADRMPAFHDRDVPEWAITSACNWLRDRAASIARGGAR